MTHQRPRGPGEKRMGRGDLARFREATYRLLSQTFLYPDEDRLRSVAAAAGELLREGGALARFASYEQWCELLRFLEDFGQRQVEEIQGEYVPLFAANFGGVPCPPYESVYREPSGRPTGWLLAQIEGEYAAAGLAPSPGLGELPDHVAVEMEFIAVLCGREAQAWEEGEPAQGIEALRAQKAFTDSHLTRWFPEFTLQIAAEDEGGAYPVICEGTQAFIAYDRDLMEALLETLPGGDQEVAESQSTSSRSG